MRVPLRKRIGRRKRRRHRRVTSTEPPNGKVELTDPPIIETINIFYFFQPEMEPLPCPIPEEEQTDSDGFSAEEFYVILDKPYKYNPEVDLDQLVSSLEEDKEKLEYEKFQWFKEAIGTSSKNFPTGWVHLQDTQEVHICRLTTGQNVVVSIQVTIAENFTYVVKVHRMPLPTSHAIYTKYGVRIGDYSTVFDLISDIDKYRVCHGNPENHFTVLFEEERSIGINFSAGYLEKGYQLVLPCGAKCDSTIRATKCNLLVDGSKRCSGCVKYRGSLRSIVSKRSRESTTDSSVQSQFANFRFLSDEDKRKRLRQRADQCYQLKQKVHLLEQRIQTERSKKGEVVNADTNEDLLQLMETSQVFKKYTDNSQSLH